LIALLYMMKIEKSLMKRLDSNMELKPVVKAVVSKNPESQNTKALVEEELIAVISAAVASFLASPVSSIKVRSIRSLEPSSPSWSRAGRQEQINSRF
jgi:glutaconyl-CoA/methylmalonyl-CoA decarboxylase subunit delta